MFTLENHGPVAAVHQGRDILGVFPPLMAVRCYLVDGLLVDTGLSSYSKRLLAWVREQRADQVVVTHHHEDHSGGAARLVAAGLAVRASEPTRALLRTGFPVYFYQWAAWGPAPRVELLPLGDTVETPRHRFQVIPAPGHCRDQVVLYEPDQGWLFSADAFLSDKVKLFRADEDFATGLATAEKLAALDFDAIFCAHYPVFTGGKQAMQAKVQYLKDLEGRVRELHQAGLSTREITRRVLGKEPRFLYFISAGDVAKHNLVRSILFGPKPRS